MPRKASNATHHRTLDAYIRLERRVVKARKTTDELESALGEMRPVAIRAMAALNESKVERPGGTVKLIDDLSVKSAGKACDTAEVLRKAGHAELTAPNSMSLKSWVKKLCGVGPVHDRSKLPKTISRALSVTQTVKLTVCAPKGNS